MQIIEGIAIIDDAFSEDYCKSIIDLFVTSSEYIQKGYTMSGFTPNWKNTTEIYLSEANIPFDTQKYSVELNNHLMQYLTQYVGDCGFDISTLWVFPTLYTLFKAQKYEKGEGHYKVLHQERDAQYKGRDRVFIFMLYLNTVKEGGETNFPLQKIEINPKMGTLIVWPAGFPYVHSGNIPLSSNKFIVTGWLEYNYGAENEE